MAVLQGMRAAWDSTRGLTSKRRGLLAWPPLSLAGLRQHPEKKQVAPGLSSRQPGAVPPSRACQEQGSGLISKSLAL